MKYILLYLIMLIFSTNAFSQSIDTVAFLKEARKHIVKHKEDIKYNVNKTLANTSNIKHIIPIYRLNDIGKYDKLSDLIYFVPDPTNQVYVLYNGRDYQAGKILYGIASYIDNLNKEANDIVRISIGDGDCYLGSSFVIGSINDYYQFRTILSDNNQWQFFIIREMKDLWAFDENKRLWHIFQENDKINIEDGEEFYQKMIEKNGIDCIKRLLEGDSCEKYIFYSPIPEKKKKKNPGAD